MLNKTTASTLYIFHLLESTVFILVKGREARNIPYDITKRVFCFQTRVVKSCIHHKDRCAMVVRNVHRPPSCAP